jgi:hypothetical protein
MISADTPKDFEAFARDNDIRGATIVLDSKGGSVHGAMAFGRAIRNLGLATTIGRVRDVSSRDRVKRGTLSPRGECQSMCAFVVLAGVKRFVPPESRVLVHQIWLGDRRDDATAAQYSAEDLVLVQRDIGRLVQYTSEMGGGSELLELALRIPPWEPMRALSRDELRRTRLDNGAERYSQAAPDNPVTTAAVPVSIGARTETGERGWSFAERVGRPALVRQHPLTIEGERIGNFEVSVACGSADNFEVTYAETRRTTEDPAGALRHVELWIEGQSSSLEIVSSRLTNAAHELQTLATGALPKSAVQSFADATVDSLTVQTASSMNPATVTRVGASGFAQNFSRLAAACKLRPARQDTQARLTPARTESAGSER